MTLENYIKDLLYRYDCVIVPDFGGFILNHKPAQIKDNTMCPPYKQITFNALIQNNDGLLANHIATTDKMPYETALNFINFEVESWINKLIDNNLELKGIGSFTIENDNIQFEPDSTKNYLTSSFGLNSFVANSVQRLQPVIVNSDVKIIPLVKQEQTITLEEASLKTIPSSNTRSNLLKYAAIFVLGASIIGVLATKVYQNNVEKQQIATIQELQKQREYEIQTATFVITNPLPTIRLNTIAPIKKYHIIAGAFRNTKNAAKKVNQLTKKGFTAKIVGKNKWNLTQVAFESFFSLEKAKTALTLIKKNTASDAWLLIKE